MDVERLSKKKGKKSQLEEKVDFMFRLSKYDYVREHKFALPRQFKADFAFLDHRIIVEVEGGTWVGGGHVRGLVYSSNCEKYNLATVLGWRVLRYTTDMIRENPQQIINDVRSLMDEKNN